MHLSQTRAAVAAALSSVLVGAGLAVTATTAALVAGTPAAQAATIDPALDSPTATTAPVGGLTVTNSFVSSVGWVKPGEAYPSRVILTNTGPGPVLNASVQVTAPVGTAFTASSAPAGTVASRTASAVTWTVPSIAAHASLALVLESTASTVAQLPTIVWRDLSTTATLTVGSAAAAVNSHGPKVIPPDGNYDTARYGDRPFPVVPVAYRDRDFQPDHPGERLADVINDPGLPGSTFNLYQEMSLGQLYPHGTVPSAGMATAGFDYGPGFDFTRVTDHPTSVSTCAGLTAPEAAGTPLYPERIHDGVYQLPGTTGYYGSDGAGSALVGALTGLSALMQIDSGCGPTGKLVKDAATVADPEIDYSDYDTDKDGVVDFFMVVFAGCGGHGASQLGACTDATSDALPYDNVWPHSSSLEYSYSDPVTGKPGFVTDDQLKDLEGRPLWYTDTSYTTMTTQDKGEPSRSSSGWGPTTSTPRTPSTTPR